MEEKMAKMPDMIAQWKKVCDFERIFASVVFVVCSTIELYSRGLIAFVISLCRIRKRRRRKQIRRQALLYYIQENIGRLFPKDHRDDSSITINPSLFRKPFSVYVHVNFILSESSLCISCCYGNIFRSSAIDLAFSLRVTLSSGESASRPNSRSNEFAKSSSISTSHCRICRVRWKDKERERTCIMNTKRGKERSHLTVTKRYFIVKGKDKRTCTVWMGVSAYASGRSVMIGPEMIGEEITGLVCTFSVDAPELPLITLRPSVSFLLFVLLLWISFLVDNSLISFARSALAVEPLLFFLPPPRCFCTTSSIA